MKSILVLLVHADPSVRAKYEAAAGADVEVLPVVRPGLSSVYATLAAECIQRGKGSAIHGLVALFEPSRPIAMYDAVVCATYSAGYAFARALTQVDRDMLLGLVQIDSAHANLDADGTAADAGPFGVAWLIEWAHAARAGRKVLAIGHSDVDPRTYASTSKVAAEVQRIAGPPSGHFIVRGYDLRPPSQARQEHGDALTVWGPGLVAEAVGRVRAILHGEHEDVPDTDPAPPPEPHGHPLPARPLGERVVDVALEYLDRGVVEVPGPGNNPQIQALLYPCRRGGTPVAGILDATGTRILGDKPADSVAWCAAIRSFFVFLAGVWTEGADRAACPHGYRCAVREHVEDARELGTLRPADGSYVPRPGDAAVFTRGGANPLLGQEGHISTVVTGGLTFDTVGGNESDALRRSTHRVGEPTLVAFITTL